jgi:hypothetical protein
MCWAIVDGEAPTVEPASPVTLGAGNRLLVETPASARDSSEGQESLP